MTAKGTPARSHGAGEILRLVERHRHRLFAQDADSGFHEGLGDLVMGGVGRGDGDEIDAVGPAAFARQHLAPVAIGAILRDAEALGEGAALDRVGVERAGDEVIEPVDARAEPVRRADLATFAAADETPVQLHLRLSSARISVLRALGPQVRL